MAKLWNKSKNILLFDQLDVASDLWSRTKGLLGHSSLPNEEALWILKCNAIHTFFMKFPIDVVFVNSDMVVKKVLTNLPPQRVTWPVFSAQHVIESAAGTLTEDRVRIGDQLHVDR